MTYLVDFTVQAIASLGLGSLIAAVIYQIRGYYDERQDVS